MLTAVRVRVLLASASIAALSAPAGLGAQAGKPYALDDVVDLVKGGVPAERVVSLARASCLMFRVNDAAVTRLRAAGATDAVVTGLRSACVNVPVTRDKVEERPGPRPVPRTVTVRGPVRPPPPETVYVSRPVVEAPRNVTVTPPSPVASVDEITISDALSTQQSNCRQMLAASSDSRLSSKAMAVGTFTAPRSGSAAVTAAAENDPVLFVYADQSGSWSFVGKDDDSGEGNSSLLSTDLTAGRRYLLCVPAYSDTTGGRSTTWSARYTGGSPASTSTNTTTASAVVGTVYEGTPQSSALTLSDNALNNGKHHQDWRFSVSSSHPVVISLDAQGFDPELALYRSVGTTYEEVATDDDSGEGMNSRIETTLTAGDYLVCARGHYATSVGAYTLAVQPGGGYTPSPVATTTPSFSYTPLTVGSAASGRLELGDQLFGTDGSYKDYWAFPASSGEGFRITTRSTGFDPYLSVGSLSSGAFSYINGLVGTGSAELDFTAPSAGTYLVQLNSSGAGPKTGSYTVLVERTGGGSPSPTPSSNMSSLAGASSLSIGTPGYGALSSSDPLFSDGSHYDFWTFYANAGDRLTIQMQSSDFTPYFSFGSASGGSFDYESSSTISGSSATKDVTISNSGTYVVRANSSGSGAKTGSYTVTVNRQ